MRVYFDASVLVPLVILDAFNERVEAFVERVRPIAIVSDFSSAEVSSVIARRVRTGDLTPDEGRTAFATFDNWAHRQASRVALERPDIQLAEQFVRRLDINLRAPDAMHIAAAIRLDVRLATLDATMMAAAEQLGCSIIQP